MGLPRRINDRLPPRSMYHLYLDNIHFDTDNGNVGALAGEIEDSDPGSHEQYFGVVVRNVHVTNSVIVGNDPSGSVGGVIGKLTIFNQNTLLGDLDFTGGSIDTQVTSTSTFTGGIVGQVTGTASA